MSDPVVRIIVVDDNHDELDATVTLLEQAGMEVKSFTDPRDALRSAAIVGADAIVSDINMPVDGFELARRIRAHPSLKRVPLILITANAAFDYLEKGFDAGANDFLTKPYRSAELIARIGAALATKKLYAELERVEKRAEQAERRDAPLVGFEGMVGTSEAMQKVYALIEKVAPTDLAVLVLGPTGSGKELCARAVHYRSVRNRGPLMSINCASLSRELIESELFGHVKGSFTGAIKDHEGLIPAADGGTLFLDEVGELPLETQARLLRVLESGSYFPVGSTKEHNADVRVIAATNKDLSAMVKAGSFREDLLFRLKGVTIRLPQLQERAGDIELLIGHCLLKYCERKKSEIKGMSPETMAILIGYSWPGGIRELKHEVERAYIMAASESTIQPHHLSEEVLLAKPTISAPQGTLPHAVAALEKTMIEAALKATEGNRSEAARRLGISRSNLIAKIQLFEHQEGSTL